MGTRHLYWILTGPSFAECGVLIPLKAGWFNRTTGMKEEECRTGLLRMTHFNGRLISGALNSLLPTKKMATYFTYFLLLNTPTS
jgi:hypothetical protein